MILGNVLHQGSRKDETEILFGLVCEACYKRGKIVLAEAEEITIGGTCLVSISLDRMEFP